MEENNRNLLLVVILSVAVLAGWQYFIAGPAMKVEQARQTQLAHQEKAQRTTTPQLPGHIAASGRLSRSAALKAGGPRIVIETPTVDGSLLLRGARFDDLRLKKYRETVDPKSPEIVLLAPKSTSFPYYADFNWIAGSEARLKLPDDSAQWKIVSGEKLTPRSPVTLEWDNGQGLVFTRQISVDDKYMFTVRDTVRNESQSAVDLYPYASVTREGVPDAKRSSYLHEGFIGVANGEAHDPTYDHFKDNADPVRFVSAGGWAGITDKYWMAAVVPPQDERFNGEFRAPNRADGTRIYIADYYLPQRTLKPGGTLSASQRLFAGAKVVDTLRMYEHRDGIVQLILAVDWGWFLVLTQPLFWVLDQLYHYLGNFGLAILALTVLVKAVTFPIANASFKTMAKMKKVQPEMERIKERFKDDPAKQQQAVMEMYKREKVNPVTGCVPQLLVIPIFIALYKVFFVTIEMYHAPFYGWVKDLSAPDPTSILNLFGLLPYSIPSFVPSYLSVGAWPIIMGATQWVQTKLNPPAADPVQQRMFSLMPIIFTFMFSTFASGLVIYYAWNNLLTIAQQMMIMRRQNVPIHLIENFKWPDFVARWRVRFFGAKQPEAGE